MTATADAIRRMKPTDLPFSAEMTEEVVEQTAAIEAFRELDEKFRSSQQFRNLLKTHARRVYCRNGDIVVRQGDWGNSAFFIDTGTVVVVVDESESSTDSPQHDQQRRKGFFHTLAQLWNNYRTVEYRDKQSYFGKDSSIGTRGTGEDTRVFMQDVPTVIELGKTNTMSAGQFFGEIGALGRSARTATIVAKGNVELVELRWQGLRELMRRDKGFRGRIDREFRKRGLQAFLHASPIFQHLEEDGEDMSNLVKHAQLEACGDYDRVASFKALAEEGAATGLAAEPIIAAEGEHPNGVVIIRSGLARVSHRHHSGHRTVSYLCPGQMYGFDEIAEGWRSSSPVPLRYSLRAIGFLTAVIIPTPLIEKYVLEPLESPSSAPSSHSKNNVVTNFLSPKTSRDNQQLVEFLVQERIVNGTATMLIDLDRCTRCDDCVRACASTHNNNPRFVRNGPVQDNIMVANACMHCQDPVCMIECPTGAISRRTKGGEITINDNTCVGCTNCAKNCPYEAIRMVEIRDKLGLFIREQTTSARAPLTKATKCDLCVDQWSGPACQRACPHDALIRMDMSDVTSLDKWKNR